MLPTLYYNAKINIHRQHSEPIYLGLQQREIKAAAG
jgi:hypothetical protein